ncbi:MAG: hypothetical protein JSU63_21500, partial [Phycisphaerales bacterium]
MSDAKKKLLVAGLGAFVLGAGSYLAFSGGDEPSSPAAKEEVAVRPTRPEVVPQEEEGKRSETRMFTAYQNGEEPTRRTTISGVKRHDKPKRGRHDRG